MLQITIPAVEQWNEAKQEFCRTKEQTLQLEHSLVSLSKWESKWQKPFLTKTEKTNEEALDYVRCMTITQKVDPSAYDALTDKNIDQIYDYINSPMTATRITKDKNQKTSHEQVTAELIYYWMIAANIPFECQKWHLGRLLTLIDVCGIKNQPPKKRSRKEIMSRNAALNATRRKQWNSKG